MNSPLCKRGVRGDLNFLSAFAPPQHKSLQAPPQFPPASAGHQIAMFSTQYSQTDYRAPYFCLMLLLKMLAAIQLNYQLGFWAIKIDDKRKQRFLPVKLRAANLFIPDSPPQALLCIRHIRAKGSGKLFHLLSYESINPPLTSFTTPFCKVV